MATAERAQTLTPPKEDSKAERKGGETKFVQVSIPSRKIQKQAAHLAQPLLHGFELPLHEREGAAQTFVDSLLQAFFHTGTDLLQLRLIFLTQPEQVGPQRFEAFVHSGVEVPLRLSSRSMRSACRSPMTRTDSVRFMELAHCVSFSSRRISELRRSSSSLWSNSSC